MEGAKKNIFGQNIFLLRGNIKVREIVTGRKQCKGEERKRGEYRFDCCGWVEMYVYRKLRSQESNL